MTATAKNCVLVSLNINAWEGHQLDKTVSREVADAKNVTDNSMCRLRKSLLPRVEVVLRLHRIMNSARTFHYKNTREWMHDGPRILMTKNVSHYMQGMRQIKANFEQAVLDMLAQMDDLKELAKANLGELYKESDYPSVDTLRHRYQMDYKMQPLPVSTELLDLGIATEDAKELQAKLEADMAETFERASRRNWEDLYERLERLYKKLSDEEAVVTAPALKAVQDMAEMLPRLNVTNDPKLEALSQRLQHSLGGLSAASLRHNPDTREKARSETQAVYNAMQAFMMPACLSPMQEEMARAA